MTMFATVPDQGVMEQVSRHFGIITGMTMPTPKGKGADIEGWKAQFSFINIMAFRNAFFEAKRRGIIGIAEMAACEEVIAITG